MESKDAIQTTCFRGDKCDEIIVEYLPYFGIDYSKKGYVFSGQGSIRPGILKEKIGDFPYIQNRLEEVDSLCRQKFSFNVSDYIYNPDQLSSEQLKSAESICLLAIQLGIYDTFRIAKGSPEVICGHSFGDFSAVVAAGMVTLENMLIFLHERNTHVVQHGIPGELIAVSSSYEKIKSIPDCDEKFWISNINSSRQQVIAVSEIHAKNLKKVLKETKIPHIKLSLGFPYHSPLLAQSCQKLKENWKSENYKVSSPTAKVILSSGMTIKPEDNFSAERNVFYFWDKLIEQLINPVDLTSTLSKAESFGVYHFIELAPFKILTDELKDLKENRKSFFSLEQLIELQKINKPSSKRTFGHLILSTLNKALGKMTGYQIADIELTNRMREDLGIDSIKKAEIIFEVLDNLNLSKVTSNSAMNLSELATVEDVMAYLESLLKAKDMQDAESGGLVTFKPMAYNWQKSDLIFWKPDANKELSFDYISEKEFLSDSPWRGERLVISLEKSMLDYGQLMIQLVQSFDILKKNLSNSIKMIFVLSQNSFSNKIQACLIRNFCIEMEIQFKYIEIEPEDFENKNRLKQIVHQEYFEPFHNEVKYIDGTRYISKLEIQKYTNEEKYSLKKYRTALVLGGTGALGRLVVEKLLLLGCEKIFIIGKKAHPQWSFEGNKVFYTSLDLAQEKEFKDYLLRLGSLDLVVNSAGVAINKKIEDLSSQELQQEIAPKVVPAMVLKEYQEQYPQVEIIHFSSIAGEFGNPGQGAYSLANYWLSTLADECKNVTTISWPAWENLGMANESLSYKAIKLSGLSILPKEQGFNFIEDILNHKIKGRCLILDPNSLPKYTSISQVSSFYKKLYGKIPARENLVSLTGITLENLPFYRDHLVKGRCVLPGSASFALILYSFYSDFGYIPILREFTAYTVAIVQENYSNFVLTKKFINGLWVYSVRSNYIHAEAKFDLEEVKPIQEVSQKLEFEAVAELDIDSLKMDAIYLGPGFIQAHRGWLSQENDLLLMVDLSASPPFSGVLLWDKIHQLIEMAAHTFGESVWCKTDFQVIPKEYKNVVFYSEKLQGDIFYFYPKVEKILEKEASGSLNIFNSQGEIAVQINQVKMSIIHGSPGVKKFTRINNARKSFSELNQL